MKPFLPIAFVLAFAWPANAGSVSVFLGGSGGLGGPGSVRVLDEQRLAPPENPPGLQGIRLLDFDLAGRTALERIDEQRSRRFVDVPGAARVRLADERGSLYHFVRSDGTPSAVYGYFLVDRQGAARIVLELPANAWNADPFLDRIAVAPDGAAFLVATRFEDGGDLYDVESETGAVVCRTEGLPPLDFGEDGLLLTPSFGAAVHAGGILRFARPSCGDAEAVPIAAAVQPPWFARELVASANGAHAVTIAGESNPLAHPFVFGASGAAACYCDTPTAMSGAGFLPYASNGPWLCVSDDGLACAWRVGIGHSYSHEVYLASMPTAQAAPAVEHLTRDEMFEPYLDETGVFVFTPARHLLFAAGDPGAGGGLFQRMDLFRASIDPASGATSVRNLSLTSGEAVPPFLTYPALAPERLAWSSSAGSFLLYEPGTTLGRLLRVDAEAPVPQGAESLLEEITGLDMLELAGADILLAVRTVDEPEDRGIQSVPADLQEDPDLVVPLGSATRVDRSIVGPDGSCTFVTAQPGSEYVWRLPSGECASASLLTSRPLAYGTTLAALQSGSVALTLGTLAGPTLFVAWTPNGSLRRLQSVPGSGCVLPGP